MAVSSPWIGGPFGVCVLDRADQGAQACQPLSTSVEGMETQAKHGCPSLGQWLGPQTST